LPRNRRRGIVSFSSILAEACYTMGEVKELNPALVAAE
jgi:hypothetical protein